MTCECNQWARALINGNCLVEYRLPLAVMPDDFWLLQFVLASNIRFNCIFLFFVRKSNVPFMLICWTDEASPFPKKKKAHKSLFKPMVLLWTCKGRRAYQIFLINSSICSRHVTEGTLFANTANMVQQINPSSESLYTLSVVTGAPDAMSFTQFEYRIQASSSLS